MSGLHKGDRTCRHRPLKEPFKKKPTAPLLDLATKGVEKPRENIMTLFIIPKGYEMKPCVWKNRSDCMKDKPLGTGDSIKELLERFPEKEYPERIFGMTIIKKKNKSK